MKRWLYPLLLGILLAAPAHAACPLAEGPSGVTVPDGYRYPDAGKWQVCLNSEWKVQGDTATPKPYSGDNTGVCLPLDQQFIKKNGMISMNFVKEKTRRKFYGMTHECVNGNWWRAAGQTPTPPAPNPAAPDDAKPAGNETSIVQQLSELQTMDPPQTPASKPEPKPAPVPTPAPAAPGIEAAPPPASKPLPGSDAPKSMELSEDYRLCQTHCREGMDQRLREAVHQCKKEQFDRHGAIKWPPQVVQDYNHCRQLAARKETQRLKTCLLPCKKQANQYIWMGP